MEENNIITTPIIYAKIILLKYKIVKSMELFKNLL